MVPCGVCLRRRVEVRWDCMKVSRVGVAAGGMAMCVFRRAWRNREDDWVEVGFEGLCLVEEVRGRFFLCVDIGSKYKLWPQKVLWT